MKKYLRIFSLLIPIFSSNLYAEHNISTENNYNYTSVFHQPVKIAIGSKETLVIFLKSNLHNKQYDKEGNSKFNKYIPSGEIYNISFEKNKKSEMSYVTKIPSGEIVSVFLSEGVVSGKSLYVITKEESVIGKFVYNTLELPIIKENNKIQVVFFQGDHPEPDLQNCYDGYDESSREQLKCKYKVADDIKKYIKKKRKK